jgi:hypothetical protein
MNAQHHQQQMRMGGQNQMAGQRRPQMQGGGNRPQPKGQPQQGKKKPNER